MVKVANDLKLQDTFENDYFRFIDEVKILNSYFFRATENSLEANRKDILHMLDVNIVKLREIYNLVNNLDMLDDPEPTEEDIEIPFQINCLNCDTPLKNNEDFSFCDRCSQDYKTAQDYQQMLDYKRVEYLFTR